MSRVLIIFAKEPQSGMVKTRLKSCFTDEGLVQLYKAFVKDTLSITRQVSCRKKVLAFSSSSAPRYLKNISRGFELVRQNGKDLGTRMHNAFVYAQENKSKNTVIMGTDSPTLPAGFVKEAFKKLDEHDLVLGPCFDGGYYLIGMKEPCLDLFKDVRWSSSSVLDKTLCNAKRLGKTTALLAEWYDVDDYPGLSRLINHLEGNKNIAVHTRRILSQGWRKG